MSESGPEGWGTLGTGREAAEPDPDWTPDDEED